VSTPSVEAAVIEGGPPEAPSDGGKPDPVVLGRQRFARVLSALATLRTTRASVVFLCSLVSGLVVSSIIIVLSVQESRSAWGQLFTHPGRTLSANAAVLNLAYGSLLAGSLGKPAAIATAFSHASLATWAAALSPLGSTLTTAAPLAIAGMGLAIAYRSGVFNIGAASQMICGGIFASWVGFSLGSLPMVLHVSLGLLAGLVGGAIGGFVPGLLKTKTGANEVIVTIMLNYILPALLTWLISDTFFSQLAGASPEGRLTTATGSLPYLFGSQVGIDAGAVVTVVVLVFGWLLLSRSRLGFELELSGTSPGAARQAGVPQNRMFMVAFCISGAIVGLSGGIQVLGSQHQLQSTLGGDVGVLAITVAFVGRNRPLGVLLASLLYGVLQNGGLALQGATALSYQLTSVVEAVIVLFMVAPALVAELYRLRPAANASLRSLALSRGWGR
jgi:simple sugar transport system permease protein